MFGQDAEGNIIQERGVRLGQRELDVLVVQPLDFDLRPQLLNILRHQGSIALEQVDGEYDVITGDRLTILPDGVGADGGVIDGPIRTGAPRSEERRVGKECRSRWS